MTGREKRRGAAVLAAILLVGIGVSGPAGAAPTTAAGAFGGVTAGRGVEQVKPIENVTLVTGDRVAMRGSKVVRIRAAAGRERIAFQVREKNGDTYVMPEDAAPLVATGRVDSRLFNVSKLMEFGYGDRSRSDVPLIVTHDGRSAAGLRGQVTRAGMAVTRELPRFGGMVVREKKATATELWSTVRGGSPTTLAAGVSRVWMDGPVRASLDESVPQIGAPDAWAAGYTGAGATVAVLDTGVDATHPDLKDAVTGARDFTGSQSGTADRVGHGTHVAGIITGDGTASQGRLVGVAPQASLLNGKVLNDEGEGSESEIIAGMEWAVQQGADVVNMSLGSSFAGDGTGPVEQAVNELTEQSGTLFVVAAGNEGGEGTVSSPAAADQALAVGAVDKQDQFAEFSSTGPRRGDGAIKPDITAPGVSIVAARAAGTELGEPVGDSYVRLSGTSMATPHVAGAAAILAAQHPKWTAADLRVALMGSAEPNPQLTVFQQGTGRVDVARATSQNVRASETALSMGTARWPHDDDQPITRTVTYVNDGTEPITLTLTVDARSSVGTPAPAGMFTVDPARITVPPGGGTAAVEVVTDTRGDVPDGQYSGLLTATGGGAVIRTAVAVTREAESYDVTTRILDHNGQSTPDYGLSFVNVDRFEEIAPYDPSGTVVARLPKGSHYLEATVSTVDPQTGKTTTTLAVEPLVTVNGDMSMTIDARDGRPVGFTLDQPDAQVSELAFALIRRTPWGEPGSWFVLDSVDGFLVRPSASSAPGQFTAFLQAVLAGPDGNNGGVSNSSYEYHLRWEAEDRVPTTLVRRIRDAELATRRMRVAGISRDQIVHSVAASLRPPGVITVHSTPGLDDFAWLLASDADGAEIWDQGTLPFTAGRAGSTRTEQWNMAPFGPGLPTGQNFGPLTARLGDYLDLVIPTFSDQNPDHYGFSEDPGSMKVFRDGELVGRSDNPESGGFTVSPEPATYRVETEVNRMFAPLSVRTSAAWTFRSQHADEADSPRALPMMALRFAPALDQLNRAPAGQQMAVPLLIQQQAGASYGAIRSVTVEESYDDGQTWKRVPAIGIGVHRTALMTHPSNRDFVSVRASVSDANGNKAELTLIRAYQLRP